MSAVVNVALTDSFTFLDTANTVVTGKANGDFTKAAYLTSSPATTATVTIAAASGQSGDYTASFTPTVVGTWRVNISCSHSGYTYRWTETYEVVTAAQADPATALTAATILTSSPVATDGDAGIYQSDHYDADETRALEWSTTDADTWPTLTSASIAFIARHQTKRGQTISATGSVVTGTGATKEVRVELTPADTQSKAPGVYDFQVIATLANSHVITLVNAELTVTERLR